MNLTKINLLCIFFFFAYTTSCKKEINQIENVNGKKALEEKFFKFDISNKAIINKLIENLKKRNQSNEFISDFVKNEGYAIWSKSQVIPSRPSNSNKLISIESNDDDSTILVPLVLDNTDYVNGFLAATLSGDSVYTELYRGEDYKDYNHENPLLPTISAEDIALQMLVFENKVFGNDNFVLMDSSLFRSQLNPNLIVTARPTITVKTVDDCTKITIVACDGSDYCAERGCDWRIGCSSDKCSGVEITICLGGGGSGWTGSNFGPLGSSNLGSNTSPSTGGGTLTNANPCNTYSGINLSNPCSNNFGMGWLPTNPNSSNGTIRNTVYSAEVLGIIKALANPNQPVSDQKIYDDLGNEINFPLLPPSTNYITTIAKTSPRPNKGDLNHGYNGNDNGILLNNLKNKSDDDLFLIMKSLLKDFTKLNKSIRPLTDIFIDRFRLSLGGTLEHPMLNEKVAESKTFKQFLVDFTSQLDQEIAKKNGDINAVSEFVIAKRPIFNSTSDDLLTGYQILINDTESTQVDINDFVYLGNGKWEAEITVTILDNFGLDKHDVVKYQYAHGGFVAWWRLQHQRNFVPFQTKIVITTKISNR
jgi:hypothetical protein